MMEIVISDQQVFFRVIAVDDGGKISRSNRASIVLAKILDPRSASASRETFSLFLIFTSSLFLFNVLL